MAETNDLPFFLPKKAVPLSEADYPTIEVASVTTEEIKPNGAGQLVEPAADSRQTRMRDLVKKSIDQGTCEILSELSRLSEQIEALRSKVISDADVVKEVIDNHFNLHAEAGEFASRIHDRLLYLANGGDPHAEKERKAAAAGVRSDGEDQGGGVGPVDGA